MSFTKRFSKTDLSICLNLSPLMRHFSKSSREVFTYKGRRVLEEGDILKRPTYARTLRIIANAGNADPVYKGVLGQQMVKDINAHGGQFMMDDFKNYKVRFRDAIEQPFGKGKLITTPPPTSGPVLSLVLNILKGTRFKMHKLFQTCEQIVTSLFTNC